MCSNMCARPVLPMGSCTDPASTCVKNEKTGASGRSQMMTVSPLASFFTVVRFSNKATSCPSANEQNKRHTTIVCIEVKRDFILPPRLNAKKSKLRGGREGCQTSSIRKIPPLKVKRDVDQHNHHRYFDQRPDHGSECRPGVNAENRNGHGNRQFKVVRRRGQRERGRLRIVGAK